MRVTLIRILVCSLALSLGAFLPTTTGAAQFEFDGECISWPNSPTKDWLGQCPFGVSNNWNDDPNLPGAMDDVTVPADYENTEIKDSIVQINSCTVENGLIIDKELRLTAGCSIHKLQLLPGGTIRPLNGHVINLTGPTYLSSAIHGPSTFLATGDLTIHGLFLWDAATLQTTGPDGATLTGNLNQMSNTKFITTTPTQISPGADILGTTGQVDNYNQLTVQGPGDSVIQPKYFQGEAAGVSGSIAVESGALAHLATDFFEIAMGTIAVAEDGYFSIETTANSPNPDRRFNGLTNISGLGVMEVLRDVLVTKPVVVNMGQGIPEQPGETGGFQLVAKLILDSEHHDNLGNIVNEGRFRFNGGRIMRQGTAPGAFINNDSGWAYTLGTGTATFDADVVNRGVFQVRFPISIETGNDFFNVGQLLLKTPHGSGPNTAINGFGDLDNQPSGRIKLEAADSFQIAEIRPRLKNAGSVEAVKGEIRFLGEVDNLQNGRLVGGEWIVGTDGQLDYPALIDAIDGAGIEYVGNGQIPDLGNLGEMDGGSKVKAKEGANVNVTPGGNSPQGGVLTVTGGSQVITDATSSFNVTGMCSFDQAAVAQIAGDLDCTGAITMVGPATLDCLDGGTITAPNCNNNAGFLQVGGANAIGTCNLACDYDQQPAGEMRVEITGETQGSEHDLVTVVGDVALAGTLRVNLFKGYVPQIGHQFEILNTSGGGTVTGSFDNITGPGISNDTFSVAYNANSVVLTMANTPLPLIFEDDFESTDTTAWSESVP